MEAEDLNLEMIDAAVTQAAQEAADSFLSATATGSTDGDATQNKQTENDTLQATAQDSKASKSSLSAATKSNGKSSDATGVSKKDLKAHSNEAAQTSSEEMKAELEEEKKPKKRVRRVGKITPSKKSKVDDGAADTTNAAETVETVVSVAEVPAPNPSTEKDGVKNDTAAEGEPGNNTNRVVTKHDEKWGSMFEKLLEYKKKHNNTMVPQCYHDDPRLGRWVHYQRVEYWIYQQTGSAKITEDRIAKLNDINFEWDPQKAQWDSMFERLKKFKDDVGHCRVPKGYQKDPELANWVRNQRLEQANLKKGKKTRMTTERFHALDDLGFKWSSPTPSRSKKGKGKSSEEQKGDVFGSKVNAAENANFEKAVKDEEKDADAAKNTEPVDADIVHV